MHCVIIMDYLLNAAIHFIITNKNTFARSSKDSACEQGETKLMIIAVQKHEYSRHLGDG